VVPPFYVPLATAQQLLGRTTYDEIHVRARSVGHTTRVSKDIRASLRKLRALPDDTLDDFRVETQSITAMPGMGMDPRLARAAHANAVEFEQASWEEMASSLRQAGRTFTLLLAAAAGVSLLVGGIGVMNIMLVSVASRTREIGLRMAVGARMRDVKSQFLVEAVMLAALGGIIGLVLGALGLLIAQYGLHWSTAVSPVMLALAVATAAATGAIFGYGPARRAAALDPVTALKAE
jgi:putative ABC transport system permease protein